MEIARDYKALVRKGGEVKTKKDNICKIKSRKR